MAEARVLADLSAKKKSSAWSSLVHNMYLGRSEVGRWIRLDEIAFCSFSLAIHDSSALPGVSTDSPRSFPIFMSFTTTITAGLILRMPAPGTAPRHFYITDQVQKDRDA